MTKDLIVGIDSSTSATKAIAWAADGTLIAEGRAAIALANPQPGFFEQDPEDWWRSTASALKMLTAKVDAARIAGLAISNQRETFSIFTESGEALRPGMVWLDDRARAQERRFGASFGSERIHAISGKPLDVIPCLYRILWLRDNEPALLDRAERIAEVHGFLAFRLTGRWATSTASADPMGMIDMTRLDWSDDILAAAGIPRDKLLALVPPGAFIGEVDEPAAAATGNAPGRASPRCSRAAPTSISAPPSLPAPIRPITATTPLSAPRSPLPTRATSSRLACARAPSSSTGWRARCSASNRRGRWSCCRASKPKRPQAPSVQAAWC